MVKEEQKPRKSLMLRGQAWVELHGEFSANELRDLADQLEKNCRGLEKKNGS